MNGLQVGKERKGKRARGEGTPLGTTLSQNQSHDASLVAFLFKLLLFPQMPSQTHFLHDTRKLLLTHAPIAVPVGLLNHLAELIVRHAQPKVRGYTP